MRLAASLVFSRFARKFNMGEDSMLVTDVEMEQISSSPPPPPEPLFVTIQDWDACGDHPIATFEDYVATFPSSQDTKNMKNARSAFDIFGPELLEKIRKWALSAKDYIGENDIPILRNQQRNDRF
jgi:hypothetical protein